MMVELTSRGFREAGVQGEDHLGDEVRDVLAVGPSDKHCVIIIVTSSHRCRHQFHHQVQPEVPHTHCGTYTQPAHRSAR